MPQRSDQRDGDSVADEYADLLDDDPADSDADADSDSDADTTADAGGSFVPSVSLGRGLRDRAAGVFSPRLFLYATVLLTAGMFAGNAFVPVPVIDSLAGLVGVFAAAFALGLAVERSTVVESAAAGALAAGLTVLLTNLTLTVATGLGVPLAAFGAGTGLLAGALGAYFGEDLRKGLTADI